VHARAAGDVEAGVRRAQQEAAGRHHGARRRDGGLRHHRVAVRRPEGRRRLRQEGRQGVRHGRRHRRQVARHRARDGVEGLCEALRPRGRAHPARRGRGRLIASAASTGAKMSHGLDSVETASAGASADTPIDRVVAWINRTIVILSSIALVLASCVLTYSVIVRYFLKISTDWQDEMSVFLIVGAVFMSSAAIQAQRGHIGIEAIVGLLPKRVNHWRMLFVDTVSLAFCAFFAWKSITLLHEAVAGDYHSSSTW